MHLQLQRKSIAFPSNSMNSLSGLSCSCGCTSVGILKCFQQIHATYSPSSVQPCVLGIKIWHATAIFRVRISPKELVYNELLYSWTFFYLCKILQCLFVRRTLAGFGDLCGKPCCSRAERMAVVLGVQGLYHGESPPLLYMHIAGLILRMWA